MNISIEDRPPSADVRFVRARLREFNEQQATPDEHRRLSVFLRGDDGRIAGGLIGGTYWHWLYIEALWVSSEERGKGYGGKLLAEAEEEAIRRGCNYVHLETFTFQAVSFYEKRGYRKAGELKNLPEGYSRILMWKGLAAASPGSEQ